MAVTSGSQHFLNRLAMNGQQLKNFCPRFFLIVYLFNNILDVAAWTTVRALKSGVLCRTD